MPYCGAMREPRYDVLFEPVRIGPKTARNRFFQVPHCNGMGHRHPAALAAMRGVKAEGGWAVVCSECVEIHHTSALDPAVEGRLWSDDDIPAHALMVERVHEHGSLAGIELIHSGLNAPNHYTRVAPIGPSAAAGHLLRCRAGAGDVAHRHRGVPRLASRRSAPIDRRGLRPRVRVCGALAHGAAAVPVAALQRSHRSLRRAPGEPGAPPARGARGHAGAVRGTHRGRVPVGGRRAAARWPHPCGRGGGVRADRGTARPVGPRARRVGLRFEHLALRAGGPRGAVRARLQAAAPPSPSSWSVGTRHRTRWCASCARASPISSVPRARRSPTRSCRARSRRVVPRTSANASAATCASPPTGSRCRSVAPRTRRWARSGGVAGIRSGSVRRSRTQRCSWSAREWRGWRPRCGWVAAATRWCSPRPAASWAAGRRARPVCPGWVNGVAPSITASVRSPASTTCSSHWRAR